MSAISIKAMFDNVWFRNGSFLLFLLLILFVNSMAEGANAEPIGEGILVLLFSYSACLFHNRVVLPLLTIQKQLVAYVVSFITLLIALSLLANVTITRNNPVPFFSNFLSALVTLAAGSGIFLSYQWILKNIVDSRKQLLEVQQELRYLKDQMNPHFLLNALNNLYGISLSEPAILPGKITELSFLLRYQLEATKKDWVALAEEIEFIESYISYQETKVHQLHIAFDVSGDVASVRLPPLLFFPLIENAIKYTSAITAPVIKINLLLTEDKIECTVSNPFLRDGFQINSTGLGYDNLRKRLDLYAVTYALNTHTNQDQYIVHLVIWRKSIAV